MGTPFNFDVLIHAALMFAHFYFNAERASLRSENAILKSENEKLRRRLDRMGHKRMRRESEEAKEQPRKWSEKI